MALDRGLFDTAEAQRVLELLHLPSADDLSTSGGLPEVTDEIAAHLLPGRLRALDFFNAVADSRSFTPVVEQYVQEFADLDPAAQCAWEMELVKEYLGVLMRSVEGLDQLLWSFDENTRDFSAVEDLHTTFERALCAVRDLHYAVEEGMPVLQRVVQEVLHDTGTWGFNVRHYTTKLQEQCFEKESVAEAQADVQEEIKEVLEDLRARTILPLLSVQAHHWFYTGEGEPTSLELTRVRNMVDRIANRFVYRVCEGLADPAADSESGVIRVEIDPEALTGLKVHVASVLFGLGQLTKNTVKVLGREKGMLDIVVERDEDLQAVVFSVIDRGIGFSFDEQVEVLSAEARTRVESGGPDVKLIDHILCDAELRDHVTPVLLQRFLAERGRSLQGGTGLGLSMVQRIVEGNGGYLDIRRNDPRGARISFVFPDQGGDAVLDERAHRALRFGNACAAVVAAADAAALPHGADSAA